MVFRRMIKLLFAIFVILLSRVGGTYGQTVSIRPDQLRQGDGKTRNITLEASVPPGTVLHISAQYNATSNAQSTNFIPRFAVQDNARGDRNPQEGKIRVVLPRAFDGLGIYLVKVDETGALLQLVHAADNRSYFQRFADLLMNAAGGGERGTRRGTAIARLEEMERLEEQGRTAIWTAPMPTPGQAIDGNAPRLRINSAMMPAWSNKGDHIACSARHHERWVIAAYEFNQAGELTERWKWASTSVVGSDFSPVWSPDGQSIAFVRQTGDQKSDIWVLNLNKTGRPKSEVRVTKLNSVQEVFGWDKDMGIVFEVKKELEDASKVSQVWALKITGSQHATVVAQSPLPDPYRLLRGSAPRRQTLISNVGNDGPPVSVIYETKASGERWTLLIGDVCSYEWPTVSPDGRWLAFDSDCSHNN